MLSAIKPELGYLPAIRLAISFWKAHSDQFEMVLFDTDQTITISEGLKDSFISDRYEVETVSAD